VVERPDVVLFDVNETLSDMRPLAGRFADVGAPEGLAATWFASVLRDGFALAAAGTSATFADIASAVLRDLLGRAGVADVDAGVEHVMTGFSALSVHPDVVEGVRALQAGGLRLATLSNGAARVAEGLLERAGIRDAFERLLSVEDAGRWKPAPPSYAYALDVLGVDASRTMLVAVHPWDCDGAKRAGLLSAWVDRDGSPYPAHATRPDVTATTLVDLATQLSR
jgi:2-haloacid dehalogenase